MMLRSLSGLAFRVPAITPQPGLRRGEESLELGDLHLHPREAAALAVPGFDLIVGSVHSLRRSGGFADAADRYADLPDAEVVREYLTGSPR